MLWRQGTRLAAVIPVILAGGCVFGPAALDATHLAYNKVLRRTNDEQLLLNLVRLRYREAPAFLEVGSISAQFTFGQSADIVGTLTEGPSLTNPHRLQLEAGAVYQERPTITLAPLQGKKFVNKVLAPLKLDVVVLLLRSGWSVDRVLRMTVQRMNGLDNASSASGPTPNKAPRYERFARVCALFRTLQLLGHLELGYESTQTTLSVPIDRKDVGATDLLKAVSSGYRFRPTEDGTKFVLTGSSQSLVWRVPPEAAGDPAVAEIVTLLGLRPDRSSYTLIQGGGSRSIAGDEAGDNRVNVMTRSLMGTLFYLSQAIETPARHQAAGIVTTTEDAAGQPFDWTAVTGDLLRVHTKPSRPTGEAVAVRHRGNWYYLDDSDLTSKSTFALLGELFALQAGGAQTVPPVLTLPVGG